MYALSNYLISIFGSNNPLLNIIITSTIFSFVNYLSSFLDEYNIKKFTFEHLKHFFEKKKESKIILHGSIITVIGRFDSIPTTTFCCNSKFKSFCHYINNCIPIHNIKTIKDVYSFDGIENDYNTNETNYFIVNQSNEFLISKENDIYCKTIINLSESDDNKDNASYSNEKIIFEIFSYTQPLNVLIDFINSIETQYNDNIENSRKNKTFVYTLQTSDKDACKYDEWNEFKFSTTKNFDNVFFDGKDIFLRKLRFFSNNESWYKKMGVPYTMGIALHGVPGSGKTTLIKCIAKCFNRHIIYINCKLLDTRKKLFQTYFENTYNNKNKKNSIGFNNKIIVFEDIDCMGDIVLDRNFKQLKENNTIDNNTNNCNNNNFFRTNNDSDNLVKLMTNEIPITLDDILNLWDGVRENDGRILIITSNQYHKLDPAIKRPGRIDIELKMDHASIETVNNMSKHFYGKPLPSRKKVFKKLTPAEITQLAVQSDSYNEFCSKIFK